MENNKKGEYLAPETKVYEINPRSVICVSGGNEPLSLRSGGYGDSDFE